MTTISVWPRLGTTVTLQSGAVITSSGASVLTTTEILGLLRAGRLLSQDPTGVNPNPSPLPDTGGDGDIPTYGTAASLAGVADASANALAITTGHGVVGDGGGGSWYWDASDASTTADGALCLGAGVGRWKRLYSGPIDVRWFGARGDGDQTLYPYIAETANPATDYQVKPIIEGYRLETRDGIAINMAIRYCRAQGGGSIYIPRGEYRVYINLETLNFDCTLYGDGIGQTVLKNCDASPTTHVFGLVMVFPYSSQAGGGHQSAGGVFPAKKITIRDMTLDGNGAARTEPTAEFSCQPLRLEGAAQVTVENVHAFNSPLDSLVLQLWTDRPDCWARISNCTFGSAFRNSVSVISGSNCVFDNCILEDGGRVHSGHSPSVCLDVEPDNLLQVGRNLKFIGCTFRNGVNGAAISQSYTGVEFSSCTFRQAPETNAAEFLVITHAGQTEFNNCFFDAVGAPDNRFVHVWLFPSGAVTEHRRLQYTRFSGCKFANVGMLATSGDYGSTIITNCDFDNSRTPVLFVSGKSVTMKNCTLTNVVDTSNFGTGLLAAMAVSPEYTGDLDIDGVTVKFDPGRLPLDGSLELLEGALYATGVYIAPTLASTSFARVANVFVSGYFRKYPVAMGLAPNVSLYGDWRGGVTAPADTAGNPAPGVVWYRNCTQYGDFA